MFIKLTKIFAPVVDFEEEDAVINTDIIRTVTDNGDGTIYIEADRGASFIAKGTLEAFIGTVGAKTVPFRNG